MPPELDADMLATLTPEERAAIEDDKPSAEELAAMQRIAAGAPNDDEDEDEDEDEDGAAARDSAAPVEGKGAADTPAPAAATTETPASAAAASSTVAAAYEAKLPSDYDDQVKTLATEEADLKAKFKGGEIDFEELEVQRAALLSKREALTVARAKAEISQEMTHQSAQTQWKNTVNRSMAEFAKPENGGIDYRKDAEKAADLDNFVKVLANRAENGDKPMDWFLTEAHKRVKALHGLANAAPKVEPVDAIKAANAARMPPVGSAPTTLAQVPGGDGPGDVAGEFADIDALEGEALEAAIAKLSPTQREKWVRGR